MKSLLIAALSPLLLTLPLMTVSPSFAEKSGGIIAQADRSLRQTAQGFTVKVLVGDTNGSGVIIGRSGNTYRVVTNAHVVNRASSYKIQAPDGKVYASKLLEKGSSLQGNDLAILTFESTVNYGVATLAKEESLQPNDVVYSTGFPIDHNRFVMTSGTITKVTPQPLKGGYQLGYSADTLQGMSGGALLNASGQLIGIVGMGKGAALMEAYTYQDESRPAKDVINQWRGMSFAVPVATINQITGDRAKAPSASNQAVAKAKNYTGIVKKVNDIAQQVSVRIDAPDGSNGSGTIIGKEGNTYSVLTACHVPVLLKPCQPENLINNLVITMPDGEKIVVKSAKDAVTILNPAIDVAVIRFTSNKNYAVATIGNYTTKGQQWLFMTGFPTKEQSKQRLLTAGTVKAQDEAAFSTQYKGSMDDGRGLVYTNQSSFGMSGGGVFDTEGRLVGVNTADEADELGDKQLNVGHSLGVPITTFFGIAQAANFSTQSFPKVANPAVEVNNNEIQQIKAQLFRFQLPQSGATVVDWINYGNSLWRAGEYPEAVKAFDQAISLSDKEVSRDILAQAYYAKGLALFDLGRSLLLTNYDLQKALEKTEEALTAFQQATKTFANFPNAWRFQGVMLRILQRYPETLIAYDQAIAKGGNKDFVPYIERGGVLRQLKRYPEALASYEQAINLKPTQPWVYNNRGILYDEKGEKELALNDFNQAIKLNSQLAIAYYNRGLLYDEKGEKELALNDYNQAILLNFKDERVYNNRGLLYNEKGEKELALNDYNQAILLNPKYAIAYANRGLLYHEKGEKELAFENYTEAIKLNFKDAQVYANRGLLYHEKGEKELAFEDYNQAILLNPKLAIVYNNRGFLYHEKGEKELAFEDYTEAIKLNYKDAQVYANRGLLYDKKGEKELALNDYTEAIKLNSKDAQVYANRGVLYDEKGEKELALNDYNQAILLNPKLAIVYANRGLLYREKGENELAFEDYTEAIKLNYKDAQVYNNRGNLYREKGEKELAFNDYTEAITIDPKYAIAYNNRGNLYADKGENELAFNDYTEAITIDPKFAIAYYSRGLLNLDLNNRQKAIQDLKTAAKLFYEQGNPAYQQVLEILKQLE